jgi:UDP-glucuronate 4-epimerase
MKILVTGAAGFIGSYISREVLWRGDDVIGIDNFHDYYPKRCKDFNLDLVRLAAEETLLETAPSEAAPVYEKLKAYAEVAKNKKSPGKFTFIEGDIVDTPFIKKLFAENRFDGVVHLAAMAGVPLSAKEPLLYTKVNVEGTVNLLESCRETNVKKFVFASTASAYGQKDHKVKEEEGVAFPWSVYGATKSAGEAICHAFYKMYGINVAVARIFGPIYGPLQRPYGMLLQRAINFVYNDKVLQIYGAHGLSTAKDFTYIDDEVTGLLLCLDKIQGYEQFNLGTSDAISLEKWFEAIEKSMGKPVKYEIVPADKGDVATSADISKAQKILGYKPTMVYEEGIRRQVEVFNLMPSWYKTLERV